MSLIDSIKGLFQKQATPAIFGFFANSSIPKMGEKEFLRAYRGWVFACTNAIAQRISEIAAIYLAHSHVIGYATGADILA